MNSPAASPARRFHEPWEPTRRALAAMALLGFASGALALALAAGPWLTPGGPLSYALGWAAFGMLCLPVGFAGAKRLGRARHPRAWFALHTWAGAAAVPLAGLHAGGGKSPAPLAMLALLWFLVAQGIILRLGSGTRLARRMGSFPTACPDPARRAELAGILHRKRALLSHIAPDAQEATFLPSLRHWLRHPWRMWHWRGLCGQETRLLGVLPPRARPRSWHIVLACILLGALAAHVFTVTFLAGYVAADDPIPWPHLAEWGRGWRP